MATYKKTICWKQVAERVGFEPARDEPKARRGVPEPTLAVIDRAKRRRLAERVGFELFQLL